MQIILNGAPREVDQGTTLAVLLDELSEATGRDPRGVAVERNLEIVPRSEHAFTVLEEGDQLELVQFVGGG